MGMWDRFSIALQVNLEGRIRERVAELEGERARRLTELAQYDAAIAELRALLLPPGEAERAASRARIEQETAANPAAPPDLPPAPHVATEEREGEGIGEPLEEVRPGEVLVDRASFMRP